MTKAPQALVIQLQSEFKALLLNLEHNTEALGVSLCPERSTVAKTLHGETPEKQVTSDGLGINKWLLYLRNSKTTNRVNIGCEGLGYSTTGIHISRQDDFVF